MFVDPTSSKASAAVLALLLCGCGGASARPARPAPDAAVRAVLVAEAQVAEGRALALDPSLPCERRLRGSRVAVRSARTACETARQSDDRDLAARCASASRGGREASRVASVACGQPVAEADP